MCRPAAGRYDCQVDGKDPVGDHPEAIGLNASRPERRLLLATALIGAGLVAACTPGGAPTATPYGGGSRPAQLATIPQPKAATIDLGVAGPGFDGTGDFYSYASDLSPEATVGAYATQLLRAGFRDAGSLGSWRVFVGPTLTIWIRVGSGGPPTSLLVRVERTNTTGTTGSPGDLTAVPAGGVGDSATARGDASDVNGPHATNRPTSQRRPDPPHAGVATSTGSGHGGSAVGGTTTGAGGTSSSGSTTSAGGSSTGTSSGSKSGTSSGGGHSVGGTSGQLP